MSDKKEYLYIAYPDNISLVQAIEHASTNNLITVKHPRIEYRPFRILIFNKESVVSLHDHQPVCRHSNPLQSHHRAVVESPL